MPRTTAVRWMHVSRNIYRGPASYKVQWRDHGRYCYEFFPLSTDLGVLRRFRDDQEGRSTPSRDRDAGPPGTWAEDVAAWLTTRDGRSCYASDRSHVKPWVAAFGDRSRHAITDGDVATTVALWERDGVKPREIRHRLQVLRSVCKLADPRAPTPADYVKVGKIEREDLKLVRTRINIASFVAQLLEQEAKDGCATGSVHAVRSGATYGHAGHADRGRNTRDRQSLPGGRTPAGLTCAIRAAPRRCGSDPRPGGSGRPASRRTCGGRARGL